MRSARRGMLPGLVMALAVVLVAPQAAQAATFTSSDQWASWNDGGYILYNNIWGSGAGKQTIWANSYRDWGVVADHPNTGGVKAYPNANKDINKKLSSLSSVKSTFSVSVPGAGAYTSAYDIWADNSTYEIMLWMNKAGAVGPLGTAQGQATVGGHSWTVYKGSNGVNQVFSFLRDSNAAAGTVDVLAVMNWIKSKGWYGDVTLSKVQFGYEITSAAGGLNFTTKDFSVTAG